MHGANKDVSITFSIRNFIYKTYMFFIKNVP